MIIVSRWLPLFVKWQQKPLIFFVIFRFLDINYVTYCIIAILEKNDPWQYTESETPAENLNGLQGYVTVIGS